MRVILTEFKQETNSFSPVVCGMDFFEIGGIRYGQDILNTYWRINSEVKGMVDVLGEAGVEIIPSVSMRSWSSGPVERKVVDFYLEKLSACVKEAGKIDGIILSLHGGMQLTDEDDGIGVILETARALAGEKAIITASTDYHANITLKCIANANAITGYHTYPHVDFMETGARAARLMVKALKGEPVCLAQVKLPMIHQAEACMTTEGPMKKVMDYAFQVTAEKGIYDFSVYQMQPWLDVYEGGAAVLAAADTFENAQATALAIAEKYWSLREELKYKLYPLDEILHKAGDNTSGKPVILSDSADSPSAGSTGDSTAVLSRLIELGMDIPTLINIGDPAVPLEAEKTGVGNTGTFTMGAKWDTARYKPLTIKAYVKEIHDGFVTMPTRGTSGGRPLVKLGKTAILCHGNITIVVFTHPGLNYCTEGYTAFGLDPALAKLVVVKSATQYREQYSAYTDLMYNVDTPGASSANLFSFDFKHLPRPVYPFDDVSTFKVKQVNLGRKQFD
jgi:microcystin degradation protein MlrC